MWIFCTVSFSILNRLELTTVFTWMSETGIMFMLFYQYNRNMNLFRINFKICKLCYVKNMQNHEFAKYLVRKYNTIYSNNIFSHGYLFILKKTNLIFFCIYAHKKICSFKLKFYFFKSFTIFLQFSETVKWYRVKCEQFNTKVVFSKKLSKWKQN